MKIVITDSNNNDSIYEVEEDRVIIGRGEDCQIQINSRHISKHHLEIVQEGDLSFRIKNLSNSNWIALNEEKLDLGDSGEYNETSCLALPGNIKVSVEPTNSNLSIFSVDDSFLEKTKTITQKLLNKKRTETRMIKLEKVVTSDTAVALDEKAKPKLQSRQRRVVEAYEPKPKKTKKKSKAPYFIGFALVIIVALVLYPDSNDKEAKESAEKVVKETEKVEVKPKAPAKSPGELEFEAVIKQNKLCEGDVLTFLCNKFLGEVTKYEGVSAEGKRIIVTANFDKRLISFLGEKLNNLDGATKLEISDSVLAMYILGKRDILGKLDKKGFFNIKIHFFTSARNQFKYKSTYSLDTSYYRRFTPEKLELALKNFRNRLDSQVFERYLLKLLVKE